MTENTDWNRRREAAESAADLRDAMHEILGSPCEDDNDLEAKRNAATALDGIDHAEEALRLWRDCEEDAVELLGEVGHEDMGDDLAEIRKKYSAQRWAMEGFAEGLDQRADDETGDHGEMVGRAGSIASDLSIWVQAYEGEADARVVENMREAEESVRSAVRLADTGSDDG